MIIFYEENGRIPKQKDFENNPEYPGSVIYFKRFGCWSNALMLSGIGVRNKDKQYSDEELLNFLTIFHDENGRVPISKDFLSNPGYPHINTYTKRFGSWDNALKLVKMDLTTMVRQGNFETTNQKGRSWEIMVIDYLGKDSVDLSGKNCNSTFDGISPIGQTYEAKSTKLMEYVTLGGYWDFNTGNEDKDEDKEAIELFYFGAFDKDYNKLLYAWEVPGEIVEKDHFFVGTHGGKFNIENMKEYEITDKFKKSIKDKRRI